MKKNRRTAILCITFICILAVSVFSQVPRIIVDKEAFHVGEKITINTNPVNLTNAKLKIITKERNYVMSNPEGRIFFIPQDFGIHVIELYQDSVYIDSHDFNVVSDGSANSVESVQLVSENKTETAYEKNSAGDSADDGVKENSSKSLDEQHDTRIGLLTDKEEYHEKETVIISLEGNHSEEDMTLTIRNNDKTYRFMNTLDNRIRFTPYVPGEYAVELFSGKGRSIARKIFRVLTDQYYGGHRDNGSQETPYPKTNITYDHEKNNASQNPEDENRKNIEVKILDAEGQEAASEIRLTSKKTGEEFDSYTALGISIEEGKYDAEFIPAENGIQNIILRNLTINQSFDLKYEEVNVKAFQSDIALKRKKLVKSFAIDPTAIEFSSGELTSVAKGNELFKCADYSFAERKCKGSWIKVMDLVPGREYTVVFDARDPAYAESLTVLNIQSYPIVGGFWKVEFETIGIDNFSVTPVDGTNFSIDLTFNELKCDSDERYPNVTQETVFYKDWSCNGTGVISNQVLTTGKHTLKFQFGNITKFAYNDASDWYNSSWNKRKNITINSDLVHGNQNDFPTLIELFDQDLRNYTQTNGSDIVFATPTSIRLDHEIEIFNQTYNSTHAYFVGWIRLNLTESEDTVIYMYYDNPSASDQQNPTGVWDSNYQGVWHLDEQGAGERYDSSIYNWTGTPSGYEGDEKDAGKIGPADHFDGIDDVIDIIGYTGVTGTTARTISMWWKSDLAGGDANHGVLLSYGSDAAGQKYDFRTDDSNGDSLRIEISGGYEYGSMDVIDQQWHYLVTTFEDDGTPNAVDHLLYVDGSEETVTTTGSQALNTASFSDVRIAGSNHHATREADGIIDEIRISNTVRSAGWINTTYLNINNQSNFFILGPEDTYEEYDILGSIYLAPAEFELVVRDVWLEPSNLQYGTRFREVRANCTNASIQNVSFKLENIQDSIIVFDNTTIDNTTNPGYYTLDIPDFYNYDSGDFELTVICRDINGSIKTNTTTWSVEWGTLGGSLIYPTTNMNVLQNHTFSFSSNLTCTGGECGNISATIDPINWWNTDYGYRKNINVTNVGSTYLTDFPAYLNLSSESGMNINYSDLRFINGSCESDSSLLLEYEIDYNDTDHVEVWVRIPTFNTGVYNMCVYYGNPSAEIGENSEGVWDGDYQVVLHLTEPGTIERLDSTQYGRSGTTTDYESDEKDIGIVGQGDHLDGSNDKIVLTGYTGVLGNQQRTTSFWFKSDTGSGKYRYIMWGSNAAGAKYDITNEGGSEWLRVENSAGQEYGQTYDTVTQSWHHLVVVFPPDGLGVRDHRLYIDGIEDTNTAGTNQSMNTASASDVWIGASSLQGDYTDGIVDEIRISNVSRSQDWINQSYQIVISQAAIVGVGPEEDSSKGDISTIPGATPFWTSSENPYYPSTLACLSNMGDGDSCVSTWSVNATGNVNSTWTFFVEYEPLNYVGVSSISSDSVNITITDIIMPTINNVECEIDERDNWQPCDTLVFDSRLRTIRANCTIPTGNIEKVNFSMYNEPDNYQFFANESTTNVSELYVFDNTDIYISDSGGFNILVYCKSNTGAVDTYFVNWSLPWGTLSSTLIDPDQDISVVQNQTFNFTSRVTCNMGECANISATLDPTALWWDRSYLYRKEVNLTNVGSSDLLNFPAYINVSYVSAMRSDYNDLRFLKGSCANNTDILFYEVENYTADHADIWINIPNLSQSGASICMYYGNPAAERNESREDAWQDDYIAVWHKVNESDSDSTRNDHDPIAVVEDINMVSGAISEA
ncbi:MAG: DUF2341 domain-containing protein, partial [Nanoarchaeota archaeon]|nr:DUF2341 domain-containing protein [Nanoarchaeota archaeon]